MLYYCDRTSFHYVSNITVCLHDQLFIKNISGRISQNVQTTRSRVTHSIYRIKSNLINTDKDISSSRSCLLSASKFIAKTQHRFSHSNTLLRINIHLGPLQASDEHTSSISTPRTQTELQGTQVNNLSCDYTSRHSTNSIIDNTSTHRRPKPEHRFNSTNSCQDSVRQRSSLNI